MNRVQHIQRAHPNVDPVVAFAGLLETHPQAAPTSEELLEFVREPADE